MMQSDSNRCPTCGQTIPLRLTSLPDCVTLGIGRNLGAVTYERRNGRWVNPADGHTMSADAFERYLLVSGLAVDDTPERPKCEHGLPLGCCKVCMVARKAAEYPGGAS